MQIICFSLHPALLSHTIFQLSLELKFISSFTIGIGVEVETEARDSRIFVQEMLEGMKALGLSGGKFPPNMPSWQDPCAAVDAVIHAHCGPEMRY